MRPDEIDLANFPFGGGAGMKLRPVLLLSGPVGSAAEVLAAYISSVMPAVLLPADHAATRLKTASVLRLHKLATIHGRTLVRRLGELSSTTAGEGDHKLRVMLGL